MGFSGVYAIVHIRTGRRYVGSAVDVQIRIGKHIKLLRRNSHHNIHLQRAWNSNGESAFRFELLDLCPEESIIICEQTHIDERAEYNILRIAGSRLGSKCTVEARAAMSERVKRRFSDPEIKARFMAARTSPEYKAKASVNAKRQWQNPELRAKIISALNTDEARAKMSAAAKLWIEKGERYNGA